MNAFWQDLRYAFRMVRKNRGFSAVAIVSLALGIGANTTIFTVINAVLLNPLPVKDISHLVDISIVDSKTAITGGPNLVKLQISYPNFKNYRDQNSVFSGSAAFSFAALTLSGKGEPQQFTSMLASANYFELLGVKPILGRMFFPDEDQKPGGNTVAVLSYSLWARQFGADPGIIGKNVTLNSIGYTVIGVAPPNFKGTLSFLPNDMIWIPISMNQQALSGFSKDFFNDRRYLGTFAIGRLKPGVTREQAEADMKTIASSLEKEYPKDNQGRTIALTLLADAAVGVNQRSQFNLAGGMLMAIVGLVLLIACVNLANLLLAQAAKREKEMSVRAALGASSRRLMRQVLTESMVLALLGGVFGLALAYWGRDILWSVRPAFLAQSSIDLSLDGRVLGFTLGVSLLTGVLFGLIPAIRVARTDLIENLKVGGRGNTMGWGRNKLRSLLVVSEIALALVALIGAGLFVRSMNYAQQLDPGFESKNLFVVNFDLGSQQYTPEHGQQYFRDAIEKAQASPGVEAAAIASNPPLGGGFGRTVFREGEQKVPGKHGSLVTLDIISTNYFQTVRIPLMRGREFSDSDREKTTQVAIINDAMAKHFWPNEEALGKRFNFFGEDQLREVVGVVRDTTVAAVGEDPLPLIYLPLLQNYSPNATLQVRTTGNPTAVIGTVRAQVQSVDRNLALTNIQSIGQILSDGLWAARMGAALLTLFALLALILASIGIYGVMAYSVSQRTQEVGIRMALGAQASDVFKLVIGQGMILAGIGMVAGLAGALLLTRVLASLLFGVSPHDPVTFGGVTLLLGVVALLACYVPARRATRIDPLVALHYE